MKFLLGIIAVLVLLCSFLGYKTYDLSEQKGNLTSALEEAGKALDDQKKALEIKDSSCKQDDTSVVELDAEKNLITDKAENITQSLSSLKKPNGASNAPQKENDNVIQKDVYLPDDGLLSPNIASLLKQAYCNTEPTDNVCGANGQSPNPPL
jgi:hypothetical protein